MDELQLKLCDIQGRLFELSAHKKYNSADFVREFMLSETARDLDKSYNRMQWAGEEYLLEEVIDAAEDRIEKSDEPYSEDVLYWMGYLYRYWHYYTGEGSAQIYKQAAVNTMKRNYMVFHTMAPEVAIEDFREIYQQKEAINKEPE